MNVLKTTVLLAALTGLLVAVGGLIGGTGGMIMFLVLAGAMNFFAYWFSDKMALRMAGAHEVTEAQEPHLYAMVREVAQLSAVQRVQPGFAEVLDGAPVSYWVGSG